MAETTAIEWTNATVNFWWGCTKVGPACDFCYAEAWDKRFGGSHWGRGVPRRKIKGAVKLIHRLDNDYSEWAADYYANPTPEFGPRQRVFVQSMSDLFDLEVPLEWFAEAWRHIVACNRIDIQIVTKRVSVIEKRLAQIGAATWPEHAGLIITVVNQEEADRDIPRLLDLKSRLGIPWVGLSCEPLLGPIDLESAWHGESALDAECWGECNWCSQGFPPLQNCRRYPDAAGRRAGLDWVIVGGESGENARPMHPDWARSLRDQCEGANVAFFFKQHGEWREFDPRPEIEAIDNGSEAADSIYAAAVKPAFVAPDGRLIHRRTDLPADTPCRLIERLGKKAAGAELDGVEHRAFPQALGGNLP